MIKIIRKKWVTGQFAANHFLKMAYNNPTLTTTRKPRRAIAIAKRREQVADLYLQGWTQMAIAAHFSIAQSTICTDAHML